MFLNISTIKDILAHPHENGFAIFVLGILFILSIYHFLLYFQNKDKSYLYYSLYTSLIFLSHLEDIQNGFIYTLVDPYRDYLLAIDDYLMWTYNSVYFLFAFTMLELKRASRPWYRFIFNSVYTILIASIIVSIYANLKNDIVLNQAFTNILVPIFFVLGVSSYYPVFKYKLPLRRYLFWGSLILLISSLTAFYLHAFGVFPEGDKTTFSIFHIGVILENIIFSLGLGYKQKIIFKEKEEAQKKLIKQLKENETLRKTIQEKLEKDVEKAKMKELKARYDKELVELKMTSLRSQMNPHFIFNSLNAIKLYIIDNEKENAVYYLNKFSKLIRRILAATRKKNNMLAEEIETTQLYLDIENIRFGNKIKIDIYIDNKLSINTIKIPSLILQPFIENSIWHGLSPKKGSKQINISFLKENDTHVVITIQDNGIGRKKSAQIKERKLHKRESLGIRLTDERLINFCKEFNQSYSLEYVDLNQNGSPAGTKVILRIPLI